MRSSLRCASLPGDPEVPDRTVPNNENGVVFPRAVPKPSVPIASAPVPSSSDSPDYVSPYLRLPLRSFAEAEAEIASRSRKTPQKPSAPTDT